MSNVYLGIDIAKDKFDAAIIFNEEIKTNTFTNNALGFKKLSKWLGGGNNDKSNLHTCMEATGIYSKPLATFCVEQDMKVSVVNPIQIKRFAQSSMVRNKTRLLA